MTRVAILIPSPGEAGNVAVGTSEDCAKWEAFLCSNAGGAWSKKEIRTLPANPSSARVKFEIAATAQYDYAIVAFSGHGRIDEIDGEWTTRVHLNENLKDENRLMPDYELRPRSPWGLVSIDSCRWDESGTYGVPKVANENVSSINLSESNIAERILHRTLFDGHLKKCERGTVMMYGCDYAGVSAGVHTRGLKPGGLFTFSLLDAATDWYSDQKNSGTLKINTAFSDALIRVHALQPSQNPQFVPGRRLGHFPLAVKPVDQILYS